MNDSRVFSGCFREFGNNGYSLRLRLVKGDDVGVVFHGHGIFLVACRAVSRYAFKVMRVVRNGSHSRFIARVEIHGDLIPAVVYNIPVERDVTGGIALFVIYEFILVIAQSVALSEGRLNINVPRGHCKGIGAFGGRVKLRVRGG